MDLFVPTLARNLVLVLLRGLTPSSWTLEIRAEYAFDAVA